MSALFPQYPPGPAFAWVSMIVHALVWPAAAVAIAAMFRAEVRVAVERLARLKYRDFEAQFRVELERLETLDVGTPAPPPASTRLLDLPTESRRVFPEVDSPPGVPAPPSPRRDSRTVIDAAWSDLARAAERAAGVTADDPAPTLAARGLVTGPRLLAFERLCRLHGAFRAEPDWQPSGELAGRFAEVARGLAASLRPPGPGAGVAPKWPLP